MSDDEKPFRTGDIVDPPEHWFPGERGNELVMPLAKYAEMINPRPIEPGALPVTVTVEAKSVDRELYEKMEWKLRDMLDSFLSRYAPERYPNVRHQRRTRRRQRKRG